MQFCIDKILITIKSSQLQVRDFFRSIEVTGPPVSARDDGDLSASGGVFHDRGKQAKARLYA